MDWDFLARGFSVFLWKPTDMELHQFIHSSSLAQCPVLAVLDTWIRDTMLLVGVNPANQSLPNNALFRNLTLFTIAESEFSFLTCGKIPIIHLVFNIFFFYKTWTQTLLLDYKLLEGKCYAIIDCISHDKYI